MTTPTKLSFINLVKEFVKDPDRKSILRILADFITLSVFHRGLPLYYFQRYLFKKGVINIKDYFSNDFLYYKIKPFFNDTSVMYVLENKLYFDFFYSQFNIRLPEILMYNHKKMFVVNSNCIEINNAQDLKVQLENIFKQNPSYDSIIIKKTYWSYGGDQIYKLLAEQLTSDPEKITELYSEVIKSGFLFQGTVKQHPELNKLNPTSLNTIRFDTFIDKDGKIEIISGYIRMSINNSFVDNITAGGCQVGIDIQSGKLKKTGFSSLGTYGVKVLTAHPVTNTVFENFSIPYFNDAKDLVVKSASFMPALRLVGWDVAIGESGPVLIEGNSDYDISGNDLSEGGYRTNAVFRKVLREINYM
jgi:hypothetical protein